MASSSGIIFPESMADFLANPVDICFGSMPAESTALAACLVIEGNKVTSNQQVKTDLLAETHPLTPRDLIAGLDHVEAPSQDLRTFTSHASWYAGNSCRVKNKIQIEYPRSHIMETVEVILTTLALSMRIPNTRLASATCSKSFIDLSSRLIAARSTVSHLRTTSRSSSPERPSLPTIRGKCSISRSERSSWSLSVFYTGKPTKGYPR
jgi:hypothetical protein